MRGGDNTCVAMGSPDVDTEFWALILHDQELLAAEFTAIVGEPGEPSEVWVRPGRGSGIDAAASEGSTASAGVPVCLVPCRAGVLPGRRWRRERSPPAGVSGIDELNRSW